VLYTIELVGAIPAKIYVPILDEEMTLAACTQCFVTMLAIRWLRLARNIMAPHHPDGRPKGGPLHIPVKGPAMLIIGRIGIDDVIMVTARANEPVTNYTMLLRADWFYLHAIGCW
jgi:hypothetical protein